MCVCVCFCFFGFFFGGGGGVFLFPYCLSKLVFSIVRLLKHVILVFLRLKAIRFTLYCKDKRVLLQRLTTVCEYESAVKITTLVAAIAKDNTAR